jgi:hypothetical protein
MSDVTQILGAIESGDAHAAGQLLPLVYGELRKLAAANFAHELGGHGRGHENGWGSLLSRFAERIPRRS